MGFAGLKRHVYHLPKDLETGLRIPYSECEEEFNLHSTRSDHAFDTDIVTGRFNALEEISIYEFATGLTRLEDCGNFIDLIVAKEITPTHILARYTDTLVRNFYLAYWLTIPQQGEIRSLISERRELKPNKSE